MALAGCLRCISVHGLSFTISLFPLLGVVYLVSMLHVLLNADVVNNRKPERSSASNRSLACAGSSTKFSNTQEDYAALRANQLSGSSG